MRNTTDTEVEFEVEAVLPIKEHTYVLARSLSPGKNWNLTDHSTLEGIPIEKWTDIPRSIDSPGGKLAPNVFAFVLKDRRDASKFSKGQRVALIE